MSLDKSVNLDEPQNALIARVNDEPFTLLHLKQQLGVADNLGFLEIFIRRILIRQLARQKGLKVTQNDLQRKVNEWRYQHRLEKVEDTEAWLTKRGITLQDVAEDAEMNRLEYLLSIHISDGKIESHFVQNRLDFDTAEICWIYVSDKGVAEELYLQIVEDDADFYALARQYSQDETTKPASGYLGRLRRRQLPKGIATRVFAAEAGSIVGPEKVAGGYALYRLQQFYPAALTDDVQKEIRKRLFNQWFRHEIQNADIVYPTQKIAASTR